MITVKLPLVLARDAAAAVTLSAESQEYIDRFVGLVKKGSDAEWSAAIDKALGPAPTGAELTALEALRRVEWTCQDPDDRGEPLFCPDCGATKDALDRHAWTWTEGDGGWSCDHCDLEVASPDGAPPCEPKHAEGCWVARALEALGGAAHA